MQLFRERSEKKKQIHAITPKGKVEYFQVAVPLAQDFREIRLRKRRRILRFDEFIYLLFI